MDRIRFSLASIGIAFISAGAFFLYAAAGIGRWFALGALTGGVLVLGGILLAGPLRARLFGGDEAASSAGARRDGVLGQPPGQGGR